MNDELRIDNSGLMVLFDAAVDGAIVIDNTGQITHFNKAAESMFGYASHEIIGKPVSALMTEEDAIHHELHVRKRLGEGLRNLMGTGRELRARRRSGSVFPAFLAVGEAHFDNQSCYLGLLRDLSKDKRRELDAARQHDQMMAVSRLITAGEMASTLAHELNQPLSAIANYTGACRRLLERNPSQLERIYEALQEIESQAHRAGETIRQMRQLATRREHQKSAIPLDSIVDEIRPIAQRDAESNNVELDIKVEDDLPQVRVDPQQIQQVLLHLLRNGLEAMLAAPLNQRNLELSARKEDPLTVRISVADKGHGMANGDEARIFDPFFTTKPAGTGMGLAICRSLLEAHGSNLQYTRNRDGGVTFFFNLPASG